MSKYLLLLVLTVSLPGHTVELKFKSWNEACAAAEASVAEGDLIFLDLPDYVWRQVAKSTNSWASHVGVVFRDKHGQWIVAESAVPFSKEDSLCHYLKGSSRYNFEVRRLKSSLTASEVERMRSASASMLFKLYDLGFDFDSDKLFCSKFAYLVYQSIGVEIGQIQTLKQLLEENPNGPVEFWKIWFLGNIPWERRTISPASELRDAKFYTVLRGS